VVLVDAVAVKGWLVVREIVWDRPTAMVDVA
jgi:hypothetical protein